MATVCSTALFWRSLWLRQHSDCMKLLGEVPDAKELLASPAKASYFFGDEDCQGQHKYSMPKAGLLPLHYLVTNLAEEEDFKASCELLSVIVEKNPGAVGIPISGEYYALHGLLDKYNPSSRGGKEVQDLVIRLMRADLSVLNNSSSTGKHPLQIALEARISEDIILAILKETPNEVLQKSEAVILGNILACTSMDQQKLLSAFLSRCPEAVHNLLSGELPLHRAMKLGLASSVLKLLLNKNPNAAKIVISTESESADISMNRRRALNQNVKPSSAARALRYTALNNIATYNAEHQQGPAPPSCSAGSQHMPRPPSYNAGSSHMPRPQCHNAGSPLMPRPPHKYCKRSNIAMLPLVYALNKNFENSFILALVGAHPQALLEKFVDERGEAFFNGELVLHKLLRQENAEELWATALERTPGASDIGVPTDDCPMLLHWGIKKRIVPNCVEQILQASPGAAKVRDSRGELPLHIALRLTLPPKLIRALLNSHKDAAAERFEASLGLMISPLSYAMTNQMDSSIVAALFKASPERALEKYRDPHSRCDVIIFLQLLRQTSTEEIWKAVLELLPNAPRDMSAEGMPLLHWALKNSINPECTLQILRAYPRAAMIRHRGTWWLPLHFAAEGSTPSDLMLELIAAYPEALAKEVGGFRDDQNGVTAWLRPVDLVTTSLPGESVSLLRKPVSYFLNPSVDREVDANGDTDWSDVRSTSSSM